MRPSVDLWKWFEDYKRDAHARNDAQRIQLVNYYETGMQYRFQDPERALHSFSAGVTLAARLGDPCWELFLNYWCCDVYIYNLRDLDRGLKKAIQNFTLAHKPAYQNCLTIGRVYFSLVNAHYRIDSEGYADKISAMMEYMSENVRLDQDTILLLQRYRAGIRYTTEEFEAAEQEALKYLELSKGNPHRLSDALNLLTDITICKKEYEKSFAFAVELETMAPRANLKHLAASALLIQALYKLRMGEKTDAEILYRRAWAVISDYVGQMSPHFYHLASNFEEKNNNPEKSLQLRNEQLLNLLGKRNYLSEAYALLNYCQFLGRTGKPMQQEIARVYEAMKKLKTQKYVLEKLHKVENGDYFDPYLFTD